MVDDPDLEPHAAVSTLEPAGVATRLCMSMLAWEARGGPGCVSGRVGDWKSGWVSE